MNISIENHDQTSGNHAQAQMANSEPPIGRFYDVAGRRLLLHRSGSGGPAVVFLPGAGLVGVDYLNVHTEVSKFTTSILYDRAGTGWSDAAKLPRTADEVVDELRALLSAADVPGPYILVGHSLGGLYAQRYAERFPEEVAGLLLLDPAHSGYYTDLPKQPLGDQLRQTFKMIGLLPRLKSFYRPLFERMFSAWPETMRETVVEYHLRTVWTGMREGQNAKEELLADVPINADAAGIPLILLSSMGVDDFQKALQPESVLFEVNRRKSVFYTALAESVPNGEHRMLESAGHISIYIDRADAVVQAIRDLLDRAHR